MYHKIEILRRSLYTLDTRVEFVGDNHTLMWSLSVIVVIVLASIRRLPIADNFSSVISVDNLVFTKHCFKL